LLLPHKDFSGCGWKDLPATEGIAAKRLRFNQLTALAPDEFPAPFRPPLILIAIAVSQAGVGSP
jgi:hypothetical protein